MVLVLILKNILRIVKTVVKSIEMKGMSELAEHRETREFEAGVCVCFYVCAAVCQLYAIIPNVTRDLLYYFIGTLGSCL